MPCGPMESAKSLVSCHGWAVPVRPATSRAAFNEAIRTAAIPHRDDQYRESMPAESWRIVIALSAQRALCYRGRALLPRMQTARLVCVTWPCAVAGSHGG